MNINRMTKGKWAAVGAGALFCAPLIWSSVCRARARRDFVPHGLLVRVGGRRMHVAVHGRGKRTIVFLPGLGTVCPSNDFMPLIRPLSQHFRCVVPEPPGYGYSDGTNRPRTVQHIVEELREALRLSGQKPPYVLLGHSISGIYALYWAARYPKEIEAVIGDDTSVPPQADCPELLAQQKKSTLFWASALRKSGLLGVLLSCGLLDRSIGTPGLDKRQTRRMRMLACRNAYAPCIIDELNRVTENCHTAAGLSFPADCGVLMFVATESMEQIQKLNVSNGFDWLAEHQKQALGVRRGKCIVLEGGHYLHWKRAEEMAKAIRAFLAPPPRPVRLGFAAKHKAR